MSDSLWPYGLQPVKLVWLCDPMNRSTPGLPVHHHLPEFTQTHVHWAGDAIHHLILCLPLLLPPSIFPSIRVFSNKSVLCIRWPKYYLCTNTVCHRDSPFFLRTVRALIKAMGKTLNQLFCVSWVSLHGYLLITSLAFPTFSEDWDLQEQCKWYSIPRAFETSWVTAALKVEPLLLWTLEFKIPLRYEKSVQ